MTTPVSRRGHPARSGNGSATGVRVQPADLVPHLGCRHGTNEKMERCWSAARKKRQPLICIERLDGELELNGRFPDVGRIGGARRDREVDEIVAGEHNGRGVFRPQTCQQDAGSVSIGPGPQR